MLEVDIQLLVPTVLKVPTCLCVDNPQLATLTVEASEYQRPTEGAAKEIQLNIDVLQITCRK